MLNQEIQQTFLATVHSGNIRQVVYPNAAVLGAGVNRIPIVSDGAAAAWAFPAAAAAIQIIAALAATNPTWLAACHISAPVVEAHYGVIQVGIGGVGPVMTTALAEFPYDEQLFAVVEGKSVIVPVLHPIRITGATAPMVAGRLKKSSGASAAGASVFLIHLEAVGT